MTSNGYVYAITAGNKTKIGQSKSPERRIAAIITQAGLLRGDCEVSIIEVGNPSECEKKSHKSLRDRRFSGEWFLVDHESALDAINGGASKPIHTTPRPIGMVKFIQERADRSVAELVQKEKNLLCTTSAERSHMRFHGLLPLYDSGEFCTLLPTGEKINRSGCALAYVFEVIWCQAQFNIEHGEPLCWDFDGFFSTIEPQLNDIAILERIVANAISDGISAGMDYKDVYQLAKARCSMVLPAIGITNRLESK